MEKEICGGCRLRKDCPRWWNSEFDDPLIIECDNFKKIRFKKTKKKLKPITRRINIIMSWIKYDLRDWLCDHEIYYCDSCKRYNERNWWLDI